MYIVRIMNLMTSFPRFTEMQLLQLLDIKNEIIYYYVYFEVIASSV